MTAAEVEKQISELLSKSSLPDSPNSFSSDDIKDFAVDYLTAREKEAARIPAEADESHWELVMDDGDLEHDAFFVVLIFHRDNMEITAGTGNAFDIKSFAEADAPKKVSKLLKAITNRFRVPCDQLKIDRDAAEAWLGRPLVL